MLDSNITKVSTLILNKTMNERFKDLWTKFKNYV